MSRRFVRSLLRSLATLLALCAAAARTPASPPPVLLPGDYRIEFVAAAGASSPLPPASTAPTAHWCVLPWRDRWPPGPASLGDAPDERWRAVDDTHWLRTLSGRPPAGLPPGPGGVAVVRALSPAIEGLERRLGSASPAESAQARRELAALREHLHLPGLRDAPPRDPPRVVVTQRWTRVSASCDDAWP